MEVEALAGKQCRLAVCGKDHMACTVIHGWVPDEEAAACMACKKNFTTIRRRVRQPLGPHLKPYLMSFVFCSTIVDSVVVYTVEHVQVKDSLFWTEVSVILCVSATSAIMNSALNFTTSLYSYIIISK